MGAFLIILLEILFNLYELKVIKINDFTNLTDFDVSNVNASLGKYNDRQALKIVATNTSKSFAYYNFNLGNFSGNTMRISCYIASENVTKPTYSWNGIKLMYSFKLNNASDYPQQGQVTYGTHNWTFTSFDIVSYEGDLVENGSFIFGLQESTGTVYFSNFTVEEFETLHANWTIPEGFKCKYTNRVLKRNFARGGMSPCNYTEQDFIDFKSWGANIFRWYIGTYYGNYDNLTMYDLWIQDKLLEVDNAMKKALELKMYIIIDLHETPGGKKNYVSQIYVNKTYHDYYLKLWETIAKRYKDYPNLWAYDLINEPGSNGNGFIHYLQSQYEVIQAIRKIDDSTPIIVEFFPWPAQGSKGKVKVFPFKDIIYELHIYEPGLYTHQGVIYPNITYEYPGNVNGTYYDKAKLYSYLQEVIDFQKKYDAKIYVGEFSAVVWAPGNHKYFNDVIEICEEQKWDWTYHIFRDWKGWSVEHDNLTDIKPNTTLRKEVVLKYFKLNKDATLFKKSKSKKANAIGIAVGVVLGVLILTGAGYFLYRRCFKGDNINDIFAFRNF